LHRQIIAREAKKPPRPWRHCFAFFSPKFTKYPHLATCYKCHEYSVNILNCQTSFSCEVASKNYRGRGKNRRARGGSFFLFFEKALNIRIWPFALNGANVKKIS
jgi:hypothetical protein